AIVNPLAPKPPHFAAKAKRVIYIHMAGSPSQLDLFDYKPRLIEMNGQPCPESLFKKERFAFIKGVPKMLGTPHKFAKHGNAGGGKTADGGGSLGGSGFLPTGYQGVQCRSSGDPVLYVSNPPGMSSDVRRDSLDTLRELNEMQLKEVGDPETVTRIAQYELAY